MAVSSGSSPTATSNAPNIVFAVAAVPTNPSILLNRSASESVITGVVLEASSAAISSRTRAFSSAVIPRNSRSAPQTIRFCSGISSPRLVFFSIRSRIRTRSDSGNDAVLTALANCAAPFATSSFLPDDCIWTLVCAARAAFMLPPTRAAHPAAYGLYSLLKRFSYRSLTSSRY